MTDWAKIITIYAKLSAMSFLASVIFTLFVWTVYFNSITGAPVLGFVIVMLMSTHTIIDAFQRGVRYFLPAALSFCLAAGATFFTLDELLHIFTSFGFSGGIFH